MLPLLKPWSELLQLWNLSTEFLNIAEKEVELCKTHGHTKSCSLNHLLTIVHTNVMLAELDRAKFTTQYEEHQSTQM